MCKHLAIQIPEFPESNGPLSSLPASGSHAFHAVGFGADWISKGNQPGREDTVRQLSIISCSSTANHSSRKQEPRLTLRKELPHLSSTISSSLKNASGAAGKLWWRNLFALPLEDPYAGLIPSAPTRAATASNTVVATAAPSTTLRRAAVAVKSSPASHEEVGGSISSQDWRAVRLDADKARILRKKLRELETWHDTMYHSGIASRLAQS